MQSRAYTFQDLHGKFVCLSFMAVLTEIDSASFFAVIQIEMSGQVLYLKLICS